MKVDSRVKALEARATREAYASPWKHALVRRGMLLSVAGFARAIDTSGKQITAQTETFVAKNTAVAKKVLKRWTKIMEDTGGVNPMNALARAIGDHEHEEMLNEAALWQATKQIRGRRRRRWEMGE